MARCRHAASPAPPGTNLGCNHLRIDLGCLALSGVSSKWDAPERLELHAVSHWFGLPQRARNADVQRLTRQHLARGTASLPA